MLIRLFDITLSLIALLIISPLFIIVIPVLRVTGEGEIFFRQIRIGKNGREFQLLKFATMLKDSQKTGTGELTIPDDPRCLPFGRFLRKTKINELPQLINVLKGDMSLIGPRPQTPYYFHCYTPRQREIISSVNPGLSGAGSVIFRNEENLLTKVDNPISFDKNVIMPYKAEIECWFVEHQSIILYIELLLLTMAAVVFPDWHVYKTTLSGLPKPQPELERLLRA